MAAPDGPDGPDTPPKADAAPKAGGAGLRRRVGPLTVGSWVLVVVAGVGLGLLIKRSGFFAGGAVGGADLDIEPEPVDPGLPGYQAAGPYAGANNSPIVTGGPERPTTNQAWLNLCVTGLSAVRNISPANSQPALMRFLEGVAVTQQQADIVGMAMSDYGPPPEGAPPLTIEQNSTGPSELAGLSNAELLANGEAALARGAGVADQLAEAVRRIEAGNLSVNHLGTPQSAFGTLVLRTYIGLHPEQVPTPENIARYNPTATSYSDPIPQPRQALRLN